MSLSLLLGCQQEGNPATKTVQIMFREMYSLSPVSFSLREGNVGKVKRMCGEGESSGTG